MAVPTVSSVSTETRLCVLVVRVVTAAWAGVAVHLAASWPSLAQVQLQEAAWAQVLPTLATDSWKPNTMLSSFPLNQDTA